MSKSRRFSFWRLMSNAVPNFARDDPNDVDLTPEQADNLVRYQLLMPHPTYLSPLSFLTAGIVESETYSKKTYSALLKHQHIKAAPGGDQTADAAEKHATVNTHSIDRNFANQIACLSVHAQRKLVGMLFFWEEECMRWRMLDEEEREILLALEADQAGGEGRASDLQVALAAVDMKKKLLPSQRAEGTANVVAPRDHKLPNYGA